MSKEINSTLEIPDELKPTHAELAEARNTWGFLKKIMPVVVQGRHHFDEIRAHVLQAGLPVVAPFNHYWVGDIFIGKRIQDFILHDRQIPTYVPASSKLFPGGEMYETEGRQMLAMSEVTGIHMYSTIQSDNPEMTTNMIGSMRKTLRNLGEIRKSLTNNSAWSWIHIEGGRRAELSQAQSGFLYLFTEKPKELDRKNDYGDKLIVPVITKDTDRLGKSSKNKLRMLTTLFHISVGKPYRLSEALADADTYGISITDVFGSHLAALYDRPERRGYYQDRKFQPYITELRMREKKALPRLLLPKQGIIYSSEK